MRWMRAGPSVRSGRRTNQTTRCCCTLRGAVVSDSGKRQRTICHVRPEELNESKPTDEASKSEMMSKRVCISRPRLVCRAICFLGIRHPALMRQEFWQGQCMERENLTRLRICVRGGYPRSSNETPEKGGERRGIGHQIAQSTTRKRMMD